MSPAISLDEFPGPLRDRLKQVIETTQTAVLVENSRPVAEIHPLRGARTAEEMADIVRALPRLTSEEAEAFAQDVEEGRRWLNRLPMRDPWQS